MRRFAKSDKVADLLKHGISNALLTEIEDERLRWVTVVEVRLSADLSHAKVFYAPVEPRLTREEAAAALGENRRAIRAHLAKHLRLRQIPDLRFEFDETEEQARRIEGIIEEIHKGNGSEGGEG